MKRYALLPVMALSAVLVTQTLVVNSLEAKPSKGPNIVDIVLANPDVDGDGEGDFDTLLTAVLAADESVLDRLDSNGQNTVFAPTDAAFESAFEELEMIGIGAADVLADTDLLTLILNYHISPGRRYAAEVIQSEQIRMRDGGFLGQEGGILTDNLGRGAVIIATDVEASNGIIHVLDNVVLPGLP